MRRFGSISLLALIALVPSPVAAQSRPRPQYQCGAAPGLDSITTEGSRWLACDSDYWGSVYLAAKMLVRYSGIDANCLGDYSTTYRTAARQYLQGQWAEANLAKSRLTCAAGRPVRIDSESISLLCTDTRWTVANAGMVNCPDPMRQSEAVNTTGRLDENGNGYSLMVRNNSAARTIRVTEWTVWDCIGVRGSVCQRHTRPIGIGPGQTVEIGRVEKEAGLGGFNFQWNYVAEMVE